ncbi:MAG: hypothetical protein IJS47_02605 [Clostridia bacterium]|nr:hypothetical protein [Clostridia bacterium]
MKYNIIAIVMRNRLNSAPEFQEILSKYGCIINLRIGYHEKVPNACSNEGLIILELSDEKGEIEKLIEELNTIEGLRIKNMMI